MMNHIDLCCGAGGLSLGFINKGFNAIMMNDINKRCCETIKNNIENVDIRCESMVDIDLSKYDFDILIGGVPCQSWSYSGNCNGLNDKRGSMILEFIKLTKIYHPKVFVIENVKGLLTHDKRKTFKYILSQIPNEYNVYHKILNANDFGVAQKRQRLFIVGVSKEIKKEYLFPQPQDYKPVLKDVLVQRSDDLLLSDGYRYSKDKFEIMKLVPEGGCWIDLPINIQKKYMGNSFGSKGGNRGYARRLSMRRPSPTILTNPNQKQTELCHPLETRPINVIESARIQSFPDWYKFSGGVHEQYKQIGNAVPVKLAEAIAESIIKVLN